MAASAAGTVPGVRDFLASLWEFALKLISHLYVVVVAVIGGILGIVSEVGSDFQTPGASPLVPLWVWLPLFGIGYGVAVIWAFHDVRMERDALQQRVTTAASGLEGANAELANARRERDEARRELEDAQRAAISAPTEPTASPFKLRLYSRPAPEYGGWITSHLIGVTSPTGQPERRARIYLVRMEPYPRNKTPYSPAPALPYTVPPESGGQAEAGLLIGPGQEESWLIGQTGTGDDGEMNVFKFAKGAGGRDLSWQLDPDERWRLSYRIACEGVPDVPFSIVIEAEEGKALPRLEG